MSVLTDELEFIWDWSEDINPDPELYDFRPYQPGLSRDQITNLTQSLPFNFPEELYQLYEWKDGLSYHNNEKSYIYKIGHIYIEQRPSMGDHLLFKDPVHGGGMEFHDLKTAIRVYRMESEVHKPLKGRPEFDEYWNESWFPIASIEGSELYVDCATTSRRVLQCNTHTLPHIARTYKSLTAMFSVIAECCEMGVYQLVPDECGDEGDLEIEIDETKRELEREIFQKYNT